MPSALGFFRRAPQMLIVLGVFFAIIGTAFLGAGFLASAETSVFAQQVAQFNKAVSVYDAAGVAGLAGGATKKVTTALASWLGMPTTTTAAAEININEVDGGKSSGGSLIDSTTMPLSVAPPTRNMIRNLLPFSVAIGNGSTHTAPSTCELPVTILGDREGVNVYPFNSTAIEAVASRDSKVNESLTVSFSFVPFWDPKSNVEVIAENFTKDVLMRKYTSVPAACDGADAPAACSVSYFNDWCSLKFGNTSTYSGTGCLKGQQQCGACSFRGRLERYCLPMRYYLRTGPSFFNESKVVTQQVWITDADAPELKQPQQEQKKMDSSSDSSSSVSDAAAAGSLSSCYYPFGPTDQIYARRSDDDDPNEQKQIYFVLRLTTDPFIALQKITLGTSIFGQTSPRKHDFVFGNRNASQAALIICGFIALVIGLGLVAAGVFVCVRKRKTRHLRDTLRYSIINGAASGLRNSVDMNGGGGYGGTSAATASGSRGGSLVSKKRKGNVSNGVEDAFVQSDYDAAAAGGGKGSNLSDNASPNS